MKFSKKIKSRKKIFFLQIFLKSRNREDFTNLVPEIKSRNSGDHEFWNHEMRGPPVLWQEYLQLMMMTLMALENNTKTSFISHTISHTSHIQRVSILDTVGAHICSPQDFIRNTLARILTADDDDDCDDLVDVGDNSVHYWPENCKKVNRLKRLR